MVERLPPRTFIKMLHNKFEYNLSGDIQVNDRLSRYKIHLVSSSNGEQTNQLEPVIENFD
jgi:hypothetical protein